MLSDARSSGSSRSSSRGSRQQAACGCKAGRWQGQGQKEWVGGLEKTKMNKSTPYNNDYEPLTLNGKENAGLQITPATSRSSSSNISQQQHLATAAAATTTKGMRHRNPSNATAKNNTKLKKEQQRQQQEKRRRRSRRSSGGNQKSDAHCVADDHQHPVAVTMLPNCQEAAAAAGGVGAAGAG